MFTYLNIKKNNNIFNEILLAIANFRKESYHFKTTN